MPIYNRTIRKKPWYEVFIDKIIPLTPLILGFIVTGSGVYFTNDYNSRQVQLNEFNALEKYCLQLSSEKPVEREFAYAMFVALHYEKLALRIIGIKKDPAGRDIAEEIKKSGSTSEQADASVVLSIIPTRVFLQISNKTQRTKAAEISLILKQHGYDVPTGIENVAGKATPENVTTVRYFYDDDGPAAYAIVALLKENGFKDATTKVIDDKELKKKAKQGNVEIWFAANTQ